MKKNWIGKSGGWPLSTEAICQSCQALQKAENSAQFWQFWRTCWATSTGALCHWSFLRACEPPHGPRNSRSSSSRVFFWTGSKCRKFRESWVAASEAEAMAGTSVENYWEIGGMWSWVRLDLGALLWLSLSRVRGGGSESEGGAWWVDQPSLGEQLAWCLSESGSWMPNLGCQRGYSSGFGVGKWDEKKKDGEIDHIYILTTLFYGFTSLLFIYLGHFWSKLILALIFIWAFF